MKFEKTSFILYPVYMCANNSLSHSTISLSDQESVILRCFALGMGNEYVCKTLAISTIELNAYLRVLMAKFGVQNQYHLIKKAFRKGFLDPSNFVLEEVKTMTLEFVVKYQDRMSKSPLTEQEKWNFYELLLCYAKELEALEIDENKKIPPKRD